MYTHMYIYTLYTYVYTHTHTHTHTQHTHTHTHTHTYIYICINVYVYIHIYIYVYICICIYIYIHIYTLNICKRPCRSESFATSIGEEVIYIYMYIYIYIYARDLAEVSPLLGVSEFAGDLLIFRSAPFFPFFSFSQRRDRSARGTRRKHDVRPPPIFFAPPEALPKAHNPPSICLYLCVCVCARVMKM